MNQQPLVVYVDVDDTLIRTAGSKRIPVSGAAEHVRSLFEAGATLFCWSSGGGEYARAVAEELKIADCFCGFLPKPNVLIDDQPVSAWRRLVEIHPGRLSGMTPADYRREVFGTL
jgi:hypothetical protein